LLHDIASTWGSRKFEETFKKLYPKAENISVDYAVAEPVSAKGEGTSGLYCIPSNIGWNDLGSWAALFEHRTRDGKPNANVVNAARDFALKAEGNYVHAPGKFVAVVGVNNLVVVETDDALLITTREASQDVGKVVKHLDEKKVLKLV
jgi:mannose-1-phosphate guanylyltransferase